MALFLKNLDPDAVSVEFGGAIMAPNEETAVSGSGLLGKFHFSTLETFSEATVLTVPKVVLRSLSGKKTLEPGLEVSINASDAPPEQPDDTEDSSITIDFDLVEGDQGQRIAGNAEPGKVYPLQLNVTDAPEINGWSATIEYDPAQVRFVSGSFQASTFIPGLLALVDAKEDYVSVGGTVLGSDAKNSGDDVLGTLSFELINGFTGSTDLTITQISFRRIEGGEDKRTVQSVATITSEVLVVVLPGDFDANGKVDFSDFFLFADGFGGSDSKYDLDNSGGVDFSDFFIFADNFGKEARGKLMALAQVYLGLPLGPNLEPNYPNPFNNSTMIRYSITESFPVRLDIFDLTGQKVQSLINEHQLPGSYEVTWVGINEQGQPVSTGIYLAKLQVGGFTEVRKMTLMK